MRKYNKPLFEFIEIRVEERLASCGKVGSCEAADPNYNLLLNAGFFGKS